ncbi:MAG: glycoside hydrolase family 15 protein [Chloroflexota bacterium]
MPRETVTGNGRCLIAFDEKMRVRDFFYPRVGLENHAVGHEFKFGIEVDKKFVWVSDDWNISMKYLPETLVTQCFAENNGVGLKLEINDAVHSVLDLYLRKIVINNLMDKQREVKVFLAHDFHIYGEDTGDTVLYEPALDAVLHYKRKRYFLINGVTDQSHGIHEFAIGQKESFGKEGTWRDAEDGILEGNPVAQGSVDSTISFKLNIAPKSFSTLHYWIACGKSFENVKELDLRVKKTGVEQLLLETENYWSAWVNKQNINLSILPKEISRLFKTSLLIMRTHVDNRGAIISSCDSDVLQFNRDTYSYMWPRDAAICAMAFDSGGFQEVSRLFFDFCNRTITDEGYFKHKYWSDGSAGSSWHALITSKKEPQLPIQLDETALVLHALWKHFQKYRDLEFISRVYPRLVIKASEFLESYRDTQTGLPKPSFDLWEEHAGTFSSTTACVCLALSSAAKFAKVFFNSKRQEELNSVVEQMKEATLRHMYDTRLGRFIKAIRLDGSLDITIDSSLAFTFLYGAFDTKNTEVRRTMKAITDNLWIKTDVGGLARYENDEYHRVSADTPGNPWIICTLWLARYNIASAESLQDLQEALSLISWATKHARSSGILAEQLNPYTAMPLSVSPLVWSHAEFVLAVSEYLEKYKQLSI